MFKKIFGAFSAIKNWLLKLSLKKKVIFGVLALVILGFSGKQLFFSPKKAAVQYQTTLVEKGTLINSIAGSGTITSGNYTNITTKTSGTIKTVYVTNGDLVKKGQKIADVVLDDYAQERQAAAWVGYLEAKETALQTINGKAQADIAMWNARQTVLDAQNAFDLMNYYATVSAEPVYTDNQKTIIVKTLDQSRKAFSVTESQYLNSDADVTNGSAKVAAALRNYQENSATIVAPADGKITDLALAEGLLVSASTTTSSTSGATIVSAQTVGKVSNPEGQLVATVSLTEIDIINVKANQKVSLTLDAYPDNTFTGKVLAVNTSGSSNSGVTSYPVTILLDPTTIDIYPNMAVTAQIITSVKTDVLLIPASAIQTVNNQPTVQVKKAGRLTPVAVETGDANDSQTEIISGLSEGDEIITSTIGTTSSNTQNTGSSPFGGSNVRMPGSFGGEVRINTGGH